MSDVAPAMSVADEIFAIFATRGSIAYFGEPVSVTEHCLQAAHCALLEEAPESLIVAALLHDIGHLVVDAPDDIADWTSDAFHEKVGGDWLAQRFGREVSEPVRLHVPAKRYLCATRPSYLAKLSPASVITLKLQGGVMSTAEVASFEAETYFKEAVRIREWDDHGKVTGSATPDLVSYRSLIENCHTRAGAR
jgi:[1-hydroxy-2-(trimethylamino)ethyl]phosphonate dioxygenase